MKTMHLAIKTEACARAGTVREVDAEDVSDVTADELVWSESPQTLAAIARDYIAMPGESNQFNRTIGRAVLEYVQPYL